MPVLSERCSTWVIVCSPCQLRSKLRIVRSPTTAAPVSTNVVHGVTALESRPAAIVITLNTEPGSYTSEAARLRSTPMSNASLDRSSCSGL